MEYRTIEQFDDILDSVINGNYTQASEFVVEYGFYAADLANALENWIESNGFEPNYFDATDLYYVIESATELRYKND